MYGTPTDLQPMHANTTPPTQPQRCTACVCVHMNVCLSAPCAAPGVRVRSCVHSCAARALVRVVVKPHWRLPRTPAKAGRGPRPRWRRRLPAAPTAATCNRCARIARADQCSASRTESSLRLPKLHRRHASRRHTIRTLRAGFERLQNSARPHMCGNARAYGRSRPLRRRDRRKTAT